MTGEVFCFDMERRRRRERRSRDCRLSGRRADFVITDDLVIPEGMPAHYLVCVTAWETEPNVLILRRHFRIETGARPTRAVPLIADMVFQGYVVESWIVGPEDSTLPDLDYRAFGRDPGDEPA